MLPESQGVGMRNSGVPQNVHLSQLAHCGSTSPIGQQRIDRAAPNASDSPVRFKVVVLKCLNLNRKNSLASRARTDLRKKERFERDFRNGRFCHAKETLEPRC